MSDSKPNTAEKMDDFFNQRADSYDQHMRDSLASFDPFYQAVCQHISSTNEKIQILDIGIGTGNELAYIFAKAPKAVITGMDVSAEMLRQLREKYQAFLDQIDLKKGSYLTLPFGPEQFHYAVSVMTVHHLMPEVKRELYSKICQALAVGGIYLEGDYYVSREKSREMMAAYQEKMAHNESPDPGQFHIDIPLSVQSQEKLLLEAGFSRVELVWLESEAGVMAAWK